MTELIGEIFDRKYRLTRLIGEGGMGSIYEAEHTRIQRKVAVKIMHSQFSESEELLNRFFREAQASSAIGHPNIIEIFDVGVRQDGTAFIVMELLEGEPLGDWMKGKADSTPSEAVSIILQVLSALVVAHEKGIVHRDLKPDNVFLSVDARGRQEVKLLDFGIAKVQGELEGDTGLTKTGTVLGTPNYMSPEQARGKPVDHRIDIWAAGVMLYQMLSKQLPFKGESYNEVLSEILLETPEPLNKLKKNIPDELVAIVEKAMAKDREQRYQNVSSMVEDLAPFSEMAADLMTDSAAKALKESIIPPADKSSKRRGTKQARMGPGTVATAKGKRGRAPKKRTGLRISLALIVTFIAAFVGYVYFFTDKERPLYERGTQVFEEAVTYWHAKKDDPLVVKSLESLESLGPVKIEDVPLEPVDPDTSADTTDTADTSTTDTLETQDASVAEQGNDSDSAEEELPEQVIIVLEGVPKRAKIFVDGEKSKANFALKRSTKPVTLKIKLRFFEPYERKIVPTKDRTIEVSLKKKRIGRSRKRKK